MKRYSENIQQIYRRILIPKCDFNKLQSKNRGALFPHTAYDYSRADWGHLRDLLRDVSWKDIFKLVTSAAGTEFC